MEAEASLRGDTAHAHCSLPNEPERMRNKNRNLVPMPIYLCNKYIKKFFKKMLKFALDEMKKDHGVGF